MANHKQCTHCGMHEHLTEAQRATLVAAAEVLPDSDLIRLVDGFICQATSRAMERAVDASIRVLEGLKDDLPSC